MESTAPYVSSSADIPPPAETRGTVRCFDRVDWMSGGAATTIAFLGYWFTLPPNVTLEMSGLMATGAMYAGVPHVPGYPVWTLYAWAFTELIPFSNIAWRVALSSAVASAFACGLIALMVSRCGTMLFRRDDRHAKISSAAEAKVAHLATVLANLWWQLNGRQDAARTRTLEACATCSAAILAAGSGGFQPPVSETASGCAPAKGRIVCSVAAALVLAFSNVVWRNAVIAYPEALSLLLFGSTVAFLFAWMIQSKVKWLALAFLCFGLLLTSNQELVVMFPGMLLAIMIFRPSVGRDLTFVLVPLVGLATAFNQYALWKVPFEQPNNSLLLAFVGLLLAAGNLIIKTRRLGTEWLTVLSCAVVFLFGYAFYFYVPLAAMTTPPVNWGYARIVEGFFHVIARGQFERITVLECDPLLVQAKLARWFVALGNDYGWIHVAMALIPFCFWRSLGKEVRQWLGALVALGLGVGPLLLVHLNPLTDDVPYATGTQFAAMYAVMSIAVGMGFVVISRWIIGIKWFKAANSLAAQQPTP